MPDRRGKPLRAGDKVIYHGAGGFWFGTLKYDEGEKARYHIFTTEMRSSFDDNDVLVRHEKEILRYFDKYPHLIINMSEWFEDIMMEGRLDLPDPI